MTSAQAAAFAAGIIWPAIFVELHFISGVARIWSGWGNIAWNSQTWVGAGDLGSISVIEGGTNVEGRGVVVTLSGLDPTLAADAEQDVQQGLPAIIYLGTFTDATRTALVVDPVSAWVGRMDQPQIDDDDTTSTLTINLETRLAEMDVAVERRYTNDDQQLRCPGDLGFQFVAGQISEALYWGRTPYQSFNP